jgi:large repetitive protein
VPARTAGTNYHLHLGLDNSQPPGSSQIFNNHIPLDPELDGALAITKTTPSRNVSRGQLVPYVITVNNVFDVNLLDIAVVDRYPAGFRYVEGSARIDGVPVEPLIDGRELTWPGLALDTSGSRTIVLLLAVGAGVSEGEFVNRAQALHSLTGNPLSGEATATVRVVPDPTFDCTDVTGKVFDDANRNGVQDPGEEGLPGVRLVTARGLVATTDQHGRFHITCPITPRETRGSNFILKLDDRSLPTGYRMTTDQVLVQRATRGKALRFNFGATIHRVVAWTSPTRCSSPTRRRDARQWRPRIGLLVEELKKAPAVLRLSYLADMEDPGLVERRLAAVKQEILDAWRALDCCYELTVEQDVFWRRGAPAEQAVSTRARGR